MSSVKPNKSNYPDCVEFNHVYTTAERDWIDQEFKQFLGCIDPFVREQYETILLPALYKHRNIDQQYKAKYNWMQIRFMAQNFVYRRFSI